MLDNHLQYWIIVIVIVVKQPAKYSWPFTHFPHPPQLPPKKRQTQLPTPSNLASTKNVCWISVKKTTHPQKNNQPGPPQQFVWKPTSPTKKQPTNRWVSRGGYFLKYTNKTHPNLCSKTADPRQTPVAPMAWTLQRPSRPCCLRQDPHPQHSWLPRRNRSCDLRHGRNGRYRFTKICGLKINQMIGRYGYAICIYIYIYIYAGYSGYGCLLGWGWFHQIFQVPKMEVRKPNYKLHM